MRARTAALALGTFCGAGYFPYGPGTLASALAVVIVRLSWPRSVSSLWLLLLAALLYFPGVWAAGECEKHYGRKDPGLVVIDEVIGQLITLAALRVSVPLAQWKYVLLGFILFRLFDIAKPFPVGRSERLPRGWGIITDDCIAGLYGFVVLAAVSFWGK